MPNIDFTNVIKRNNHPMAFTTAKPNGDLYAQRPKHVRSTGRPTVSDRFVLTGDMIAGNTVTLRTNGYHNFGIEGPNLLMYLDAADHELGPITDTSQAKIPRSNTSNLVYSGASRFNVVAHNLMPGGKGIQDGSIGSLANDTNSNKFWCDHAPHTRGFEMRCNMWPLEHQDNAVAYYAANTGITWIWQEKGIWSMANKHYGGLDTNLFYGGAWRGQGLGGHGGNGPILVTSNSLVGVYGIPSPETNRPMDFPPTDPTTYEYTFDQYAANEVNKGYVHSRQYCESLGVHVNVGLGGLALTVPTGLVRVINSFSFPGFVRGYNIPLNLNRLDAFIYKTNGAGACCRVVLCNNANYKLATKVTPLEIVTWDRYEVAFKPRAGWFNLSNLSGVFLALIDYKNDQIDYIAF